MSAMRKAKSGRFYRRAAGIALIFCASALAQDPAYRLDLGTSMVSGTLRVEPAVSGPGGKTLRYEINIRRDGKGASAATSQAGTVHLDGAGKGQFAYNSLSINPGDRYTITVKVYDGNRLVASEQAVEPK
ncbi:MAG TPA: curli-like amyloid fiber formation chaperone CsgH [Burkholderiales bacterium]|nr:curli-like amyloid fiber formation chaperone CsgH [Burkholderiales bacterium]